MRPPTGDRFVGPPPLEAGDVLGERDTDRWGRPVARADPDTDGGLPGHLERVRIDVHELGVRDRVGDEPLELGSRSAELTSTIS